MIALLVVLATSSPAERPIVDTELSGLCETSSVAVYASGFAHFQVSDSCGSPPGEFTSGLRKVSRADLQKLKTEIVKAGFDSLPESIEPDRSLITTEEEVFSIRVWHNGIAKRVQAFGLDRAQDKGAAQRFQALWAAVAKFGREQVK